MESTGLVIVIILMAWAAISVLISLRLDDWRARVDALHLRWEREQRQAASGGVTLSQRQHAQATFEELVAMRPSHLMWTHLVFTLIVAGIAAALAWNADTLNWSLRWLIGPLGVLALLILGIGWLSQRGGSGKLAVISSTLYGPAPPRVKVRNIQVSDATSGQDNTFS